MMITALRARTVILFLGLGLLTSIQPQNIGAQAPAVAPSAGAPTPAAAAPANPGRLVQKLLPFTPGGKWRKHDINRPRPRVIDPGTPSTAERPGQPPSDAIVLFDGTDFAAWQTDGLGAEKRKKVAPRWKIENGYMEVVPKSGLIETKQRFGDSQIHVEWATPAEVKGTSQGRGNSGILLGGPGEVQVLDSYDNDTYPDGQAAALYGLYPPQVNASRKPGEWQTYDIIVEVPRFNDKNELERPGRVSVMHNGVLVHHAAETGNEYRDFAIQLQDHLNPVRYRNIWVRPLRGYDQP